MGRRAGRPAAAAGRWPHSRRPPAGSGDRGGHRRGVRRAGVDGVVRVQDQRPQPAAHLLQAHPPVRVLDHQRGDHLGHRPGDPRLRHLAVDHLGDRAHRVALHVVRRAALDGREQRGAQAPQVRGGGHRLTGGHLRGDVGGRPENQAGTGHRRVGDVAGDPEVGQLDPAVVGDQHVARLDVAVGDAAAVRGPQRAGRGEPDHRRLRHGQRAVIADHGGQVARGHHLQHDHRGAVDDHHVEHGDDVGVGEPTERPGLAHDPLAHVPGLVRGHPRRNLQLLDRDPALQHFVVAGPHGAHRSAAQQRGQQIATADAALLTVVRAGHPPYSGCSHRAGAVGPGCVAPDGARGGPPTVPPARPIIAATCAERHTGPLDARAGDRSSGAVGPPAADPPPLGADSGEPAHSVWYTAVRVSNMGRCTTESDLARELSVHSECTLRQGYLPPGRWPSRVVVVSGDLARSAHRSDVDHRTDRRRPRRRQRSRLAGLLAGPARGRRRGLAPGDPLLPGARPGRAAHHRAGRPAPDRGRAGAPRAARWASA